MELGDQYLVPLVEVATEAGWGVEQAARRLRIEIMNDWASRPSVRPADANRLIVAAREEREEWASSQPRWEDERAAWRKEAAEAGAATASRRNRLKRAAALGAATGISVSE